MRHRQRAPRLGLVTPEPSLPGTITSVFAIRAHGAVSDAIRMALLAASRVMVIPVPCSKMVLTEGKTVAGVIRRARVDDTRNRGLRRWPCRASIQRISVLLGVSCGTVCVVVSVGRPPLRVSWIVNLRGLLRIERGGDIRDIGIRPRPPARGQRDSGCGAVQFGERQHRPGQ